MTKRIEIPRRHRAGDTIEWFGDILTFVEFVSYDLVETDDNTETYGPRYRMSDGGTILFRA